MTDFALGLHGLELDAPSAGDIVTVKLKPYSRPENPVASLFTQPHLKTADRTYDESKNPHHYRHTTVLRVLAANAGQAVVEHAFGHDKGRREIWAIDAHRWFEASELLAVLETATSEEEVE